MSAIIEGHIEIVKLLLSKGANVNKKSNHGDTALMLAKYNGHIKIADLLRKAGAKE